MSKPRDYNIHHYTDQELLNTLDLKKNDPQNEEKIDSLIDKLRQKADTKDIIFFLEEAKKRLFPEKFSQNLDQELVTNANPLNNPIPTGSSSAAVIKSDYSKRTLTTTVSLNTLFRSDYFNTTPNNFTIKFPAPFKNVISMKLSALELVNSWYNISAEHGTHTFQLTVNNNSFSVNIKSGNPSAESIIEQITAQIATAANTNSDFTGLSATFDDTTGRITLDYNNSANNYNLEVDFSNPTLANPIPMFSLGWILGFRNQKYKGGKQYISESIVNLAGPAYVYLCVEDYQTSVNDTVVGIFNNSILSKKILARVPVTSASNTIIFEDPSNDTYKVREYFGPVNIEKLKVTVLDQYGNVLNLNDLDYSLALELTILHTI